MLQNSDSFCCDETFQSGQAKINKHYQTTGAHQVVPAKLFSRRRAGQQAEEQGGILLSGQEDHDDDGDDEDVLELEYCWYVYYY
jgi:hypothetical protein